MVGSVAPARNLYWAELLLPAMCSVVDSSTAVLSYQPRDARLASSKFSWNSNVPPAAGGGGGGGGAFSSPVEATATFDSPPRTAPASSAPRNASTWKL